MIEWKKITDKLEQSLRLRTFPLALKFFEDAKDTERIKGLRKPKWATLCQVITVARTFGWTLKVTSKNLNPMCAWIIGLRERIPEKFCDAYGEVWFKTKEEARKKFKSIPRVPSGKYEAVVIAPLRSEKIDPDIVLLFGNPAQIMLIINGIQWEDYERFQFFSVGESACVDLIPQCYLTKKLSLTLPCFGERRFGHVQDDELEIALPPDTIERLLRGLRELNKSGIRYPIPYLGSNSDPRPGFPPSYLASLEEKEK